MDFPPPYFPPSEPIEMRPLQNPVIGRLPLECRGVPVRIVVPVGSKPARMLCHHCHNEIISTTIHKPGVFSMLFGAALTIFLCCLLPCYWNECLDVEHYCPMCKEFLGRYKR